MKKIILIGFFPETAELCERAGYTIVGVVDKKEPTNCSYPYLGNDSTILNSDLNTSDIPILLVPDAPELRMTLYEKYCKKGFRFETVISPHAYVSPNAIISEGCMIQDGCNISSNVKIGKCVRVNSLANIMHDVSIGDFSTIAPSSVVLGYCDIKELTYIGANATILPGKIIQAASIIGAGAVVTKNVETKTIVVGVPARTLRSI